MNNMNPTGVVSTQVILKRAALVVTVLAAITFTSAALGADTGSCGGQTVTVPFTDVMGSGFFCQIAAAYYFLHFLVILPLVSAFETTDPLPNSISESVLSGDAAETPVAVAG